MVVRLATDHLLSVCSWEPPGNDTDHIRQIHRSHHTLKVIQTKDTCPTRIDFETVKITNEDLIILLIFIYLQVH